MIRLSGPAQIAGALAAPVIVGQITGDADCPLPLRPKRIFLARDDEPSAHLSQFKAIISTRELAGLPVPVILQPDWANYLQPGDVVAATSDGTFSVVYRKDASANSLLVTERCSSNCIMCSQPPKARNDEWLYDLAIAAIEHIPEDAPEIGVTGGEPLLNASKFLSLLYRLKTMLPRTAAHVLTNGRMLAYLRYSQAIASIAHPDLMLGIPLYSASPSRHDFVVQAKGAFDQTIRGILNAKRCGLRVEIRVVLHQQTAPGLIDLAEFLTRHMPFVDQVALMGLEHIGYVKPNAQALKAHPREYSELISRFLDSLDRAGVRAHLFNLPLCFVDESSWRFARKSISDWKNDLPPQCEQCAVKDDCCGFFTWNASEYADTVRPFSVTEAAKLRSAALSRR